MIPAIPTTHLINLDAIAGDPNYLGLKIIHVQTDEEARNRYTGREYRFQHETDYTVIRATLTRKGMVSSTSGHMRLAVHTHPTLKQFRDVVQYDPSNPPHDNYDALGMKAAHDQTQSDFKGQKQSNRILFRDYLLESVTGQRTAYLPSISGWQTKATFPKTVFVAFDEEDADALYGQIYLPKAPIMQADGQTQTAALFALAGQKEAVDKGALENFRVTLEIELNVDERKAGQSFADRNGRGSRKNKNLVIGLDSSSAMSDLREKSIEGTVFENRVSRGRNTSTSVTATGMIVDLSTMEQMLMGVISELNDKPETVKHYHVPYLLPYTQEFIKLLDEVFAHQWLEKTPANGDPFRKLYVHGWPFALKAIASAYHAAKITELGPLSRALRAQNAGKGLEQAFLEQLEEEKSAPPPKQVITFDELKQRLEKIDWLRYRKHWIKLTGAKQAKNGKSKMYKLKSVPDEKVEGQAQNTKTVIAIVRDKILSDKWEDLTTSEDAV
jgi:hypothetical protein